MNSEDTADPVEYIDALEQEITTLWGHITVATHRFLELVAEFDRAEGWGGRGFSSCAHWLNLHCGIGMVAAREKVRVAAALEELPKIGEAFASGQISYSKVRAITRVATPEMQDALLNIALHGAASHVEQVVRDFRRCERIEEAERAERRHQERYLRFNWDDDGSMLIQARLPPEVGALVQKAIEAAMEVVEEADRDRDGDAGGASLSDSASGTDSAGGLASSGCDLTLHDSAESWVQRSIAEESGVSRATGIAEAGGAVSAEASGVISAAELREHMAPCDSLAVRRCDALRLLAEQFLANEAERLPSSSDRFQVVVHIDQRLLAADAVVAGSCRDDDLTRGRSDIEHGPALAIDTARRLACDSALVGIVEDADGNPLDIGRKSRAIPPAMRRALASRDRGCRFPGCDRTRFTDGHHVVHWADGGETRLANLATLCRFHHRLVHEGGIGIRALDDGALVFTTPDGRRIEPPPRPRIRGVVLPDINADRGLTPIRAPGWRGERLDRGLAVDGLWRHRRPK